MSKSPKARSTSQLSAVPKPGTAPREPSRLMSLLVVDILAARKVVPPPAPADSKARKKA